MRASSLINANKPSTRRTQLDGDDRTVLAHVRLRETCAIGDPTLAGATANPQIRTHRVRISQFGLCEEHAVSTHRHVHIKCVTTRNPTRFT